MGWRTAYAALRGAIGRLAVLLPFRRSSRPTEAYTGRQQIRAAIRTEVARQVGHAPIPRRIRREAGREVARRFGKGKSI